MTPPPPLTPVRYADSGGTAIAYQLIGEGTRDIVLVPGFVSHQDLIWEDPATARFLHRLASFGRLVLWDKREQGLSDRTGRAPTLEQGMDDLRAVLDAAGVRRATLIGMSEGGPLSMLFAAAHPDRVVGLGLVGTCARLVDRRDGGPGMAEISVERFCDALVSDWGGPVALDRFAPSVAGDPRVQRWWARLLRSSASPAGARALLDLYRRLDVRHVLDAIRVPTVVLHREGDRLIPVAHGRDVAARIADARMVELPGDDHLPMFGDADAVLDELEELVTGARSAQQPDRVLATVLFTDIVASTARAAELGDRAWRDVLIAHDRVVRAAVERHRGRLVKSTGDGSLATFDGPARAIEGAQAIRDEVARLGLQIRAGLHTGECEVLGGDVGGIALHIGSRVAASAEPGEIRVSRTVADLVAGSPLRFEDRGEHDLRGVPGRWQLYAVAS